MINVNGQDVSLIHVRHDGRSHGIHAEDLGIAGDTTQSDLFNSVENYLDLGLGSLSGYELDITSETQNAVIRPQAKFGQWESTY